MENGPRVARAKERGPKAPGAKCQECPLSHRPFVPTTGPNNATVFVLGEGPGEQEARQGQPFVGPSGRLLDQLLLMQGIRRVDVAVGNTVSCHPIGNADPPKEAIEACRGYLDSEIRRRPVEKILALGKFAAQQALKSRSGILKLRVGPPKASPDYPGISVIPSIHPAATFRNGDWYPHLVSDVRKLTSQTARWIEPTYEVVDDAADLHRSLEYITSEMGNAADLYVDAEWAPDKALLCLGIAWAPNRVLVVGQHALADSEGRRILGDFLETRRLSAHFGRADIPIMRRLWPDLCLDGDSLLAHYTLDERSEKELHGLDRCAQEHLGTSEWKSVTEQYVGTGKHKDYSKIPLDVLYKYNAWDTSAGYQLKHHFEAQIKDQGRWEYPYQYMIRVSNMLMEVEDAGLEIDMDSLERLEREYKEKLNALEAEFVDMQLNPRSPKQVTQHLAAFGITTSSTNVDHLTDILGELRNEKKRDATHSKYRISWRALEPREGVSHRASMTNFIERMLTYRKYDKLGGTYVKGVRDRLVIVTEPGSDSQHTAYKIYPRYLQHTTVTGRLSSIDPNQQNWPRPSTPEGKAIRNLVRARPGHILIGADYAQGEFRIVAWLSGAKWALEVFNDPNRKIFKEFATNFYGPDYSGEEYTRIKNVVYGSLYGGSAAHLATISGNLLETKKLQRFVLREACPEIGRWQSSIRHRVVELNETLETPYGRRRHFWADTLKLPRSIKEVENKALDFLPQSILSDLNCEAACELVESGYAVRILVHDAIYVEAPIAQQARIETHVTQVMESVAARRVPGVRIPAEAHSATHWGDIA